LRRRRRVRDRALNEGCGSRYGRESRESHDKCFVVRSVGLFG
jgi:hypothetical protein